MSTSSMGPGAAGEYTYIGELAGTRVFNPIGDQVGKIHDVVTTFRVGGTGNIIGFVVRVGPRRRVFLPLTRVTPIGAGSIITTDLLNIQSFTQRPVETLVLAELFDRVVTLNDGSDEVRILDVVVERHRLKGQVISKLHVQRQRITALGFTRSGETLNVRVSEVSGLLKVGANQAATSLVVQAEDMRPTDLADCLHDLPIERQMVIAQQLPDAHLADVLEEFDDGDRVAIVSGLEVNRTADILDVMQSGDAANLVSELPEAQAQVLLSLMEPEEAKDVRRLLSYAESTAGSLMMTGPMIFDPNVTVAQVLASVQRGDLSVSLATVALITRLLEGTPTGPYLGMVHIQRALCEPPQTLLGMILDSDIEAVSPQVHIATVTRLLAAYSLTVLPVVNEGSHLLGAVPIDDLLSEFLPGDWRDYDDEMTDRIMARSIDG